jgi:hypothetical protein
MKKTNLVSFLAVCLVVGLLISGCITIVTKPEPVPTNPPAPTLAPSKTPIPAPTPVPVLIASGTITIPQTYQADLDTGIVPTGQKDSAYGNEDLRFEAMTSKDRYLEPINGASWAIVGSTAVGYDQCKDMPPTTQRAYLNDLPSGTYICVTTNVKNTSVVRINHINAAYVGKITIDFMTWQQP